MIQATGDDRGKIDPRGQRLTSSRRLRGNLVKYPEIASSIIA
ncbi:hypothetical protein [Candidatus Rickettsia kedanie]